MDTERVLVIRGMADVQKAVDLFLAGRILLLKLGSVYGFVFDPRIDGLSDKLNKIKGREGNQHLSLICSFDRASTIVDRGRVNPDFFGIGGFLCAKAILRIPLARGKHVPFPYNQDDGSVQFHSLRDEAISSRNGMPHSGIGNADMGHAFYDLLDQCGCPFLSGTSGNIHGMPVCTSRKEAEELANMFNERAAGFGISDTKAVVVDIPDLHGDTNGSFPIVSFMNPDAVEVIRLMESGLAATQAFIKGSLGGIKTKTPVLYP